ALESRAAAFPPRRVSTPVSGLGGCSETEVSNSIDLFAHGCCCRPTVSAKLDGSLEREDTMMNVNKLLGSTSGLKLRSSLIVVATILVCSVGAGAQQWKDALKAEKAKNGQRQDAINTQGAPIAASLRKVTAQIETH